VPSWVYAANLDDPCARSMHDIAMRMGMELIPPMRMGMELIPPRSQVTQRIPRHHRPLSFPSELPQNEVTECSRVLSRDDI
jgi:hypothetical protein